MSGGGYCVMHWQDIDSLHSTKSSADKRAKELQDKLLHDLNRCNADGRPYRWDFEVSTAQIGWGIEVEKIV